VLIVEPDGAAKKRSVKVGLRTTDKVQIVEGVSPADLVITEGGYGLDDGTKVKVGSSKGDETQDRNSGSAPEGAKD
jgi:multidrug efflux pump subunit AcrA (membrane-fusion protein)